MKTTSKKGSLTNVNQLNKEKSSKNKQLIKRKRIENSPFEVITQNGKSFGVMGQYRLTEMRSSKKEVIEELTEINWNRIIQIVMIIKGMDLKIPEVNENTEKDSQNK